MDFTLLGSGRLIDVVQPVLLLAIPFDRDVLGSGPILPDDVPGSVSALVGVAAVIVGVEAELGLEELLGVEGLLGVEDDGWWSSLLESR